MTSRPPATGPDHADGDGPIPGRVESVDLLRGLVMVVMALDHVREFFMDVRVNPTDLSATTPALFLTRWVTHYCAPTFVLLAGISASFSGLRRTRGELSRHLLVRGLVLIVLEQTVESVLVFMTYPRFLLGLVLWSLGWSMIALAGLIFLPRAVVGGIGLAMIALHNTLDGFQPEGGAAAFLWSVLHVQGMQTLPGGIPILLGYPLIPWAGVMAVGYALGPIFQAPARRRAPILIALGMGSIAAFFALRWLNVYGDPGPRVVGAGWPKAALSFLNCRKNPPSLQFLLMTLGPAFLALAAFDRGLGRPGHVLHTFGRVPLFFYLSHWAVVHALAILVAVAQGFPIAWMFQFPSFQYPPGYGSGLPMVYAAWVVTVALMYFPCRWYWRRGLRRRAIGPTPSGLSQSPP